ncbi:Cytosolic seryl-tRNA synthetase [Savitreella phatthalungensis]
MLDLLSFIQEKGGDPEAIRESQRRRGAPVEAVDQVIEQYKTWTSEKFVLDGINKEINALQKQISQKMRAKEDASELLAGKQKLEADKLKQTEVEAAAETKLKRTAISIGNLVHSSVPVSMDEDNNEIIRTWTPEAETGKVTATVSRKIKAEDGTESTQDESISTDISPEKKQCLSHHEVLTRIHGYDPERGVKIIGHRGYFLRQYGVLFNQALINYGLTFLGSRGYIPLQTPQLMNKDVMAKTAQLEQFDEELYKVIDGDEEKYLIATSEQPISAYHADEWIDNPADLPIKYAGFSSCYRREAGSHGKDAWGIFRVHQFEKIEQFVLTAPDKSWEMFDDMIGHAEAFYQSLRIPYRVVAIVSGALNNAAAKKYDLEAWFPFQGEYKELVSCSNCTDYQSRRLEIRFGQKKANEREKKYVHCLNSTLCATERALCCILENYQTPTGVVVPEVLRPFMGGATFIPYTKDLPKNTTSAKRN